MIEVNGMAHVILTVSSWDKAHAFYGGLLPFLGLKKVFDGNNFLYHVGGRTAVGIQRCAPEHEDVRFEQNRVGLHHLCLRARTREDVDEAARKVRELGGRIDMSLGVDTAHRRIGSRPIRVQPVVVFAHWSSPRPLAFLSSSASGTTPGVK